MRASDLGLKDNYAASKVEDRADVMITDIMLGNLRARLREDLVYV
jgi:hypothetical protein